MDCAFGAVGGKDRDDSFDLPPAAEVDDVAQFPASVGARGGFAQGVNAVAVDKVGRVGDCGSIRQMNMVEQKLSPPSAWLLNAC